MRRRPAHFARSCGGNAPTPDARLVQKWSVRAPVRRVVRVETDEYGLDRKVLTCGHSYIGKARKDGRFSCYDCQCEEAQRLERESR